MSEEQDCIVVTPQLQNGEPCIRGTRLPAGQMAWTYWQGESLERMLQGYPSLTRTGLLLACWFVVRHGRRPWARAWRPWADRVMQIIWWGRYDDVPLPPRQGEG